MYFFNILFSKKQFFYEKLLFCYNKPQLYLVRS
jgi:hypothetical protein